jgi:hypothetical protein
LSIFKTRYSFTEEMIAGAPRGPGVYALWNGDTLIYIGNASGTGATIHSRLLSHLAGGACGCSREATHYSWEIAPHPGLRELEMLQEHRAASGELPYCNRHG